MLQGIRIVELEALGPAPFAGMLLADLGAEVIVVQRPGGPSVPGQPDLSLLNRGKRSIALDLKDADDLAVARDLIGSADALIEGYRPGVLERLGLAPETLTASNPKLVVGRMTGWGQDGPRAQQAGHDLNYTGLTGALWYSSVAGQVPAVSPTLLGDIGGGAMYLVAGVLAGVLQAQRTGQGAVIDAAIVDGTTHMMALLMSMQTAGGFSTSQRGDSLLDGAHWSRNYSCSCGGYVSVQCLEPKFYALFLEAMGLADDPDFAAQFDRNRWPELSDRLASIFLTRSRDEWAALFDGSDACVAPILSPDESAEDPHIAARGLWQMGDGQTQPSPAPRVAGAPAAKIGAIPARNADGAAIRRELTEKGRHT